jgi:hypothetical protein
MILLPALPTAPGTINMAEILGNSSADAYESGNFGALLAVQISTDVALPAPATTAIPTPVLPDSGKILPPLQSELMAEVLPLAQLSIALPRAVPDRVNAKADSEPDAVPVSGPESIPAKPSQRIFPCVVVPKAKATHTVRPDAAVDAAPQDQAAEFVPQATLETPIRLAPVQLLSPTLNGTVPHFTAKHELVAVEIVPTTSASLTPLPQAAARLATPPQSPILRDLAPAELTINAPVALPLAQYAFAIAERAEAVAGPFTRQSDPLVDQPSARTLPANGAMLTPLPSPLLAIAALPIAAVAAADPADPLTRAPINLRIRKDSAEIAAPIMLTGKPGDASSLVYEPLHGKAALLREVAGTTSALTEARPPEPASTTPGPSAIRPLDFSALVDRLTQARDAATPQSVSLAFTHAEFGKISLRFEQDDAGLSVGMTSPDPDFARAVSAALPPERAGPSEQQSSNQGQVSRHEPSNSDMPGHSRGGTSPERREERGAPRPAAEQASRNPTEKPGRGEIFA